MRVYLTDCCRYEHSKQDVLDLAPERSSNDAWHIFLYLKLSAVALVGGYFAHPTLLNLTVGGQGPRADTLTGRCLMSRQGGSVQQSNVPSFFPLGYCLATQPRRSGHHEL